jgi:type I restriction enzyme S subunit
MSKKGWKTTSAEEYCIKVADGTHDSPKPNDFGQYLITSKHITGGKINLSNAYLISEEDFKKINLRSKVDKWDVLLTMIGTVGEVALVDHEPMFAIKNIGLFKCGNEIKAKWLKYYLQGAEGQSQIQSQLSGTTQEYITLNNLRKLTIAVPPPSEQHVIISILSSLDDKIDLLHRQNKTLEAMAETLFQQWFVEEADEGWKEGKLPDEFDFTMGQSPAGNSFKEDGIGTPMFQGNADFGFRFPSKRIYTTEPTRFAEPLDTLISVRAPVGAQNMALEKCCIGRGLGAFRYAKNNEYYTYTYFKLRSLMSEIKQFNNEGTVFGSIRKADLEALDIIIPPDKIISSFEMTTRPINDKIIGNCRQIWQLEQLRDTLLPKLMSGEVKLQN